MRGLQAKDQAKLSMPKAKAQWVMTPKEIQTIERAILKGKSTMVIAKETGRSSSAICKIKRRMVEDGWITKR
jgi:DNA-binding MarR family transcriptional regulator